MRSSAAIAALSLLAACNREASPPAEPANVTGNMAEPAAPGFGFQEAPAHQPPRPAAGWDLQATQSGAVLSLLSRGGPPAIRLFCPAARSELLVNVPAFRPIGSEERLSFGSGSDVTALVADTRGDAQRGGVSGAGAVPANLAAFLDGQMSASYGNQTSGPHAPPPPNLGQRFAAACYKRISVPAPAPGASAAATPAAGPCMMQGSEQLRIAPLRAVGTEPFWGARIEGRCVTYSHPEDQAGTRIWTRYTPGPNGGGTWAGALGGRRFELRTRPEPGCSDGMSDRRYPIAVDLIVGGEQRKGCAAPL